MAAGLNPINPPRPNATPTSKDKSENLNRFDMSRFYTPRSGRATDGGSRPNATPRSSGAEA